MRYYFASDMHLGLGSCGDERAREQLVVGWLDSVANDATAIYLMGDIFDFWFEYRRVVPKGFVRLLGKLAELTDKGVEIHFFTGNHDMWVYDYLNKECGVMVHTKPEVVTLSGWSVYLAHGDGLGRYPMMFRVMNSMFHSNVIRKIFSCIVHPDLAMRFGQWWSMSSRHSKSLSHSFLGDDERLVVYSRKMLETQRIDYFIYGHTHCAVVYPVSPDSQAVFLGEWLVDPSYAVLDESGVKLLKYNKLP